MITKGDRTPEKRKVGGSTPAPDHRHGTDPSATHRRAVLMGAVRCKDGELPIALHRLNECSIAAQAPLFPRDDGGKPFSVTPCQRYRPVGTRGEHLSVHSGHRRAGTTVDYQGELGITAIVQREPSLAPVLGYKDGVVVVDADGGRGWLQVPVPYRYVPVLSEQEQLRVRCHDDAVCEPAARASVGRHRDPPQNLTAFDVDQQRLALSVLRLEEESEQRLVNDGGPTEVA